ncbi:NADH-quinone oxidoreductase subunit C [Actinacidiphila acidipaludis]|uniref:NADH-quinone oxidoreductase subunit C n=1 Tax=Actinacidiphila acidipaludis TaxID=2873382 RepID=A0ABS7Q6P6_9ACTN|nr:NADH-quinone oxidoreductase subunit C [Streptomyces acidipaludis]MBY8878115.1 NADH-quinone oxidoreductase subunit C [Streptomyces acidipaludis]
MTGFDRLPDADAEIFGEGATAAEAYGLLTVDVPPASWIAALTVARDGLGCTFFDWLSAVDEPGTGFRICAHVVRIEGGVRRLMLRTTVPHEAPAVPTATDVYAGAAWHERETHEMFGVEFAGHPDMAPLLLPPEFEGHPLRKDFVLAARVAKAWPGAKEPGESHDGGPKRRQMLPPGVPDPNEWGPLKGQLPPAPTRAERPARRTRTAAEGSASQPPAERPPRRTRTAAEGSASQAPAERPPRRPATSDAPWSSPRPAPEHQRAAESPAGGETGREPEPRAGLAPSAAGKAEPDAGPAARGEAGPEAEPRAGGEAPAKGKAEPGAGHRAGGENRGAGGSDGAEEDDEHRAGGDSA